MHKSSQMQTWQSVKNLVPLPYRRVSVQHYDGPMSDCSENGRRGKGKEKRCVVSGCVGLPKQQRQIGSSPVEEVAAPSQQATDTSRIGRNLIAAHRAIPFLDPPANGTFAGIIGAIPLLAVGSTPLALARQTAPQGPAIQKQQTQPRGEAGSRSFLGRSGFRRAARPRFQLPALLRLPTLDQFS